MYGITLRFSRRYGWSIKPELKATFKFRIRGVARVAKETTWRQDFDFIDGSKRRLDRSLIELDYRSGNLYQLASKFHGRRYPTSHQIDQEGFTPSIP